MIDFVGRLEKDGGWEIPAGKLVEVVTFLEMNEPPPRRPPPERPDLALELMEELDLDRFRRVYGAIGRDWLWSSRLALSDAELAAIIGDLAVEVRILRADGRDAGLLELDFRGYPEVELAFFGLVPEQVGTGAGRWLMDRAIGLAWRAGVKRFWVHTCNYDHPAALGFYVRSGFRPYRRAIEIGDDPRLVGILPPDAAPQVPIIRPASEP